MSKHRKAQARLDLLLGHNAGITWLTFSEARASFGESESKASGVT